jgi:hypothetical protein
LLYQLSYTSESLSLSHIATSAQYSNRRFVAVARGTLLLGTLRSTFAWSSESTPDTNVIVLGSFGMVMMDERAILIGARTTLKKQPRECQNLHACAAALTSSDLLHCVLPLGA